VGCCALGGRSGGSPSQQSAPTLGRPVCALGGSTTDGCHHPSRRRRAGLYRLACMQPGRTGHSDVTRRRGRTRHRNWGSGVCGRPSSRSRPWRSRGRRPCPCCWTRTTRRYPSC
jgi:hypothetical protein